jgi:hypothetical protein
LEVWVNAGDGAICDFQDDSIPHYLTDHTAAIRAAEAWKEKVSGRTVTLEWLHNGVVASLGDMLGGWHRRHDVQKEPAAALAQALLRATGGPA